MNLHKNKYRLAAAWIICGALIHALGTRLLGMLALKNATAAFQGTAVWLNIHIGLMKILYSPLITLGLYPRGWFPGSWIGIVMGLNSLLWGVGLYLVFCVVKKIRRLKNSP